jgi:hypothetical protein
MIDLSLNYIILVFTNNVTPRFENLLSLSMPVCSAERHFLSFKNKNLVFTQFKMSAHVGIQYS